MPGFWRESKDCCVSRRTNGIYSIISTSSFVCTISSEGMNSIVGTNLEDSRNSIRNMSTHDKRRNSGIKSSKINQSKSRVGTSSSSSSMTITESETSGSNIVIDFSENLAQSGSSDFRKRDRNGLIKGNSTPNKRAKRKPSDADKRSKGGRHPGNGVQQALLNESGDLNSR